MIEITGKGPGLIVSERLDLSLFGQGSAKVVLSRTVDGVGTQRFLALGPAPGFIENVAAIACPMLVSISIWYCEGCPRCPRCHEGSS